MAKIHRNDMPVQHPTQTITLPKEPEPAAPKATAPQFYDQDKDADYEAPHPAKGRDSAAKAGKAKSKKDLATFDLASLRFNKVVICTDADVDGYQIRTLILTMLYRLVPTLIEKGYVYIAESPLYEINTKNKTYFAYTEQEKAGILARIEGEKYTIQRSKGLGENDPEMMWLTTMNPASRRLIQVLPADAEETSRVFDLLLGDNLAGRKEHIALHGAEYLDDLDVS